MKGKGARASVRRVMVPLLVGVLSLAGVAGSAAAAKTKVTLATYGSSYDAWKKIAKAFNDTHQDYELKVDVYPFNDYIAKITTLVAGGNAPDVFQTWAQYKPKWAEQNMLLDLTPYWQKSKIAEEKNFYPFIVDSVKHKGKYYGTPFDYNTEVWFLNLDRFDDAGLNPPSEKWTTEDFRNYALKLTKPKEKLFGATNAVDWGWGDNLQWVYNWSGHEWLNKERTKVMVDDQKTAEMLEFWYKLGYEDKVIATPQNPSGGKGYFEGGLGMYQGWLSYAFQFGQKPRFNWGAATMPKALAAQRSFAQGHMWSIPASAKNPDASWVVCEWLISPEGQKVLVSIDNDQPLGPDPELWELFFSRLDPEHRKTVKKFLLETLYGKAYARTMTYWVTWPEMNDVMIKYLNQIYNQQKPIANTMKSAAKEMRAILDRNPGK